MTTKDDEHAIGNARAWVANIREMVADLRRAETEGGGCWAARDAASDTIQESVLSVEVRDGWKTPGAASDGPEEYRILLTIGGPGCQIVGKLGDHGQPDTVALQWSDWFKGWQNYPLTDEEREDVHTFACCFYFGE